MRIVGIGASAGGLDALRVLFGVLPRRTGAAWVVVVHLSPEHESHLADLLQPHCAMPVLQVTETVALEPDTVYVIPPNANLETIDTHLRLAALETQRSERAPIDRFLETLAEQHDGDAIGVILTGVGRDGSRGLRRVKERGGITMVQDPDTAAYEGMPRSAIDSGCVDRVLPLRDIGRKIVRLCSEPARSAAAQASSSSRGARMLSRLAGELEAITGHDATRYRFSALRRAARLRMQALGLDRMSPYLTLLRARPKECELLLDELLGPSPQFFDDAPTVAVLERRIVPAMLERLHERHGGVRIWCIGCGTGALPYSLAMLVLEAAERERIDAGLQVFASEALPERLRQAREGRFPEEIAAHVSPERLHRFFVAEHGRWLPRREVRESIVFAPHDLLHDPPFSHLDLIACRNLLPLLHPWLRHEALEALHYALEPDGSLVLGPGETVERPDLFAAKEEGVAVFGRRGDGSARRRLPALRRTSGFGGAHRMPAQMLAARDDRAMHARTLDRAAPSLLLDARRTVVHQSEEAARWLNVPGGDATHDVFEVLPEPLRQPLRNLLADAPGETHPMRSAPITLEHGGVPRRVVLQVHPVDESESPGRHLVIIEEAAAEVGGGEKADDTPPRAVVSALRAFDSERRDLHRQMRDEAESHTLLREQMEAANEELQSANEELRSVLEELHSSKEDLQSVNEELVTVNDENQRRVQELSQLSADLHHLLQATGIATLFLDRELRVVRYTQQAGELFNLRDGDRGRAISDLTNRLGYPELADDARRVLDRLVPVEREVCSQDERWYLTHVRPYRMRGDTIDGVVITLIDITDRRRAEDALRDADRHKDEFLATLAHELRNPLAPISIGLELLRLVEGDPAQLEAVRQRMDRQLRHLVRLVDDLLDVSRVTRGKLELRRGRVELGDVLRDAVAATEPLVQEAHHALAVELPDEPVVLDADAARLTQVFSNLIGNAVKYTPVGGRIAIGVERCNGDVLISVRDSGIGIPAGMGERIFEMFSQVDPSNRGGTGGLGIGLTLARWLVEMHGGTITAHSEGRGEGSEFRVRLPVRAAAADAASAAEPAGAVPSLNGCRVLIADDNEDAAQTLRMLVGLLGTREVFTARDGAEAFEAAAAQRPDVILLDLGMPKMDGYEVARRIRSEPWGENVTLVALTGWGQDEDRRRTKEAGFDHHLLKPADLATLQSVFSHRHGAS